MNCAKNKLRTIRFESMFSSILFDNLILYTKVVLSRGLLGWEEG